MIKNVKKAYRIARKIKRFKKYDVCYCREDDVSYFFTYPVHGFPVLRIYKENENYEEIFFGQDYESFNEKEIPLSELKCFKTNKNNIKSRVRSLICCLLFRKN